MSRFLLTIIVNIYEYILSCVNADSGFISREEYLDLELSEEDTEKYFFCLDSIKYKEILINSATFDGFKMLWKDLEGAFIGFKTQEGKIMGFSHIFINGIIGYGTLENSKVKIEDVETALQTEPERGRYCFNHVLEEVCLVSIDIQSLRIKEVKPLLPKSTPIVITEEQKKFLGKHIKNLDEILEKDDANDLLKEIFRLNGEKGFLRNSIWEEIYMLKDLATEPLHLRGNKRGAVRTGERRSPLGRKLNRTYYEIFDQSRKGRLK